MFDIFLVFFVPKMQYLIRKRVGEPYYHVLLKRFLMPLHTKCLVLKLVFDV